MPLVYLFKMKYTLLLIDFCLLLIPFCFLIGRQALTLKQLVAAIIPAFVTTIIFTEMSIFWTGLKVISFDNSYLLGGYYRTLPAEFYLFIFSFNFAALGIYNFLNLKFPNNDWQKYSLALSNIILGVCVAFIFFAYTKWYTVVIFAFLLLLLLFIEYKNQLRFMYRFYRGFAVTLILFVAAYGLMCNLPIIRHQVAETADLFLFNLPFESILMMMGMMLLTVYVAEFIKDRTHK